MAERCLELLSLSKDKSALLLDLGCGSGLSGSVFQRFGHLWIGADISSPMLNVAKEQRKRSPSDSMDIDSSDEKNDSEFSENESDLSDSESYLSHDEDDSSLPYSEEEFDYKSNDSYKDGDEAGDCVDLLLGDMGEGIPFRPGTFDGCVSVSALQWLCHSNKSYERPRARLSRLFSTLFAALTRGARAVFQLYPESATQIDLILACATRAGFSGGLVIDYPNSARAKKYYLCLMTGGSIGSGGSTEMPCARGVKDSEAASNSASVTRRIQNKRALRKARKNETRRDWIVRKKERARSRGVAVKADSKYTARRRKTAF